MSFAILSFSIFLHLQYIAGFYINNNIVTAKQNRYLPTFSSRNDEANSTTPYRPPIIPFDFARADIKIMKTTEKLNDPLITTSIDKKVNINDNKLQFSDRPAGYDNDSDDEDESALNLETIESDNVILKLFKDIFVGSIYDSSKKQQARFIVRSITVISFGIGIIFTGIWYLFPGKFVNYRGDVDLTQRYSEATFIDPNNLLDNEFQSSNSIYFDDSSVKAEDFVEQEITRFAPVLNEPARAPGNTVDL
jgi:hypothetical protein